MSFSPFLGLILVPFITVCAYKNKNKQFLFFLSASSNVFNALSILKSILSSQGGRCPAGDSTDEEKGNFFYHFQNPIFGAATTCHTHLTGATAPGQKFHPLGIEVLGVIVVLGRCQEHP